MNRTLAVFVVIVLVSPRLVHAVYDVRDEGAWPKSWPKELDRLRAQSITLQGPQVLYLHYAIPFTKRDEFEAAWPHLLKVTTHGAPMVLKRGPSFWLGEKSKAGVCIHTPPEGEAPVADGKDAAGRWERTIYIELIVDGDIVDLNRILLPPDTPIVDKRFEEQASRR